MHDGGGFTIWPIDAAAGYGRTSLVFVIAFCPCGTKVEFQRVTPDDLSIPSFLGGDDLVTPTDGVALAL
jgi:hypothetical protein